MVASKGPKTSLMVRPASTPPAVWNMKHGIARLPLRSQADAAARVGAGLIAAPAFPPIRTMTAARFHRR